MSDFLNIFNLKATGEPFDFVLEDDIWTERLKLVEGKSWLGLKPGFNFYIIR